MYRMQRNQGFQNISFKWPEPQKFPSWLELLGWKAGERNHPKDTSHQFLSMHSHVVYVQVPGAKRTRSEDPLAFFTHHILLHRWCHVLFNTYQITLPCLLATGSPNPSCRFIFLVSLGEPYSAKC